MIGTDYIFGVKAEGVNINSANTFLKGAAGGIPDASTLAFRLGINEIDISFFAINGEDVEARIEVSYAMRSVAFRNKPTYWEYNILKAFIDKDNLCTEVGISAFDNQTNFENYKLDGVLNIASQDAFSGNIWTQAIFPALITSNANFNLVKNVRLIYTPVAETFVEANFGKAKGVYIPNCTQLGNTTDPSINNGFFAYSPQGVKIWAHPSMETVNNGQPEADIAWAIANKEAVVSYSALPNNGEELLTPPPAPLNLQAIETYGTALRVGFDPVNHPYQIEYYEVWIDEVLNSKNKSEIGAYGVNLNPATTYNIQLVLIDEFGNKSPKSDILVYTTNSHATVSTQNLFSYYKLEGNAVDSYGGNDGTNYGATATPGKLNNAFNFDGNDYLFMPAHLDYYFAGAGNPFTTAAWFKTNQITSDSVIFGCGGGIGTAANYAVYVDGAGQLQSVIRGVKTIISSNITDVWNFIAIIWNGSEAYAFFNGDFIPLQVGTANKQTIGTGIAVGRSTANVSVYFKGIIDEFAIYNNEANPAQLSELFNNGNGITI